MYVREREKRDAVFPRRNGFERTIGKHLLNVGDIVHTSYSRQSIVSRVAHFVDVLSLLGGYLETSLYAHYPLGRMG